MGQNNTGQTIRIGYPGRRIQIQIQFRTAGINLQMRNLYGRKSEDISAAQKLLSKITANRTAMTFIQPSRVL